MLNKIKEYISELGKDSAAISDQQQNDTEIINNSDVLFGLPDYFVTEAVNESLIEIIFCLFLKSCQ